jgi:RNA polymerase sigma factor (sigma-70 family)
MADRIAVHVLDDDHTRRAQIARCALGLGHHAEVYADAQELAAHAPRDGVIVALEDAIEDGVSGLIRLFNREGRWLAVIATSPDPTIDKAVSAIRDGAVDYLPLPLDLNRLRRALDAAQNQGERVRETLTRKAESRALVERLTPREREVIALMAEGWTNKEIGRALGISPRTVEIHRTNALTKLGTRRSANAVAMWNDAAFATA